MLLSKLFVPLTIQIGKQSLTKLRNSLHSCSFRAGSSKEKICPKADGAINPFAISRLENYKEALQKCPKTQSKQDCQRNESQSKCQEAPVHAADAYVRTFAETQRRALELQTLTRNSSNELSHSLRETGASRASAERTRAMVRLREIGARLDDILEMSLTCGARKRLESYAIAEGISARLQSWQCENESGERRVRARLEALECWVKERTETALEIVRTCRGCVSPAALLMCVEMTGSDAAGILDATEEHVRKELTSIEEIKEVILRENDAIVARLMGDFEAEARDFLAHLDSCVVELKRLNKKR